MEPEQRRSQEPRESGWWRSKPSARPEERAGGGLAVGARPHTDTGPGAPKHQPSASVLGSRWFRLAGVLHPLHPRGNPAISVAPFLRRSVLAQQLRTSRSWFIHDQNGSGTVPEPTRINAEEKERKGNNGWMKQIHQDGTGRNGLRSSRAGRSSYYHFLCPQR